MSDNCIPHTMVFLWLPMLPPTRGDKCTLHECRSILHWLCLRLTYFFLEAKRQRQCWDVTL